ncbi:hypothetical protein Y032_0289g1498 [Ancylostoma ceylanicum]|uniref:Uncharacterized protein n=1 Tax=Ancylostoma ceylanicum TaxID=53326 RepID=A0A016S5B5_9BILA|nr:hypothetical protein Y032_0289g1498 [Ancylostoma ceylanicum]
MEENGESMWRMTRSRMSRRLTSTPNSTTTSYSFSYVARESKTVSPLEWFTSHSRHVSCAITIAKKTVIYATVSQSTDPNP